MKLLFKIFIISIATSALSACNYYGESKDDQDLLVTFRVIESTTCTSLAKFTGKILENGSYDGMWNGSIRVVQKNDKMRRDFEASRKSIVIDPDRKIVRAFCG